jgi:hypothetical protein
VRRAALLVLLVATPAAADRLVIPQVAAPIRCDGELDEVAWRSPARTGPFTDAKGDSAAPYSEARLLRDDRFVYLALYAADEDIRSTDEFVVTFGRKTMHFRPVGAGTDVDGSVDAPADDDEEWLVEAAIPLGAIPFAADGTVAATISRCDLTKDGKRRCGAWRGTLMRR